MGTLIVGLFIYCMAGFIIFYTIGRLGMFAKVGKSVSKSKDMFKDKE